MAESLVLTNGKLAELAQGLAALDGLRTSPTEFKPYKFEDHGDTIWKIAGNSVAVGDALKAFERAKKLLAVQHGVAEGMAITKENVAEVAKFMEAMAQLEDKPVGVAGLQKLSRTLLLVGDKNHIPPSVLAKLTPLLED